MGTRGLVVALLLVLPAGSQQREEAQPAQPAPVDQGPRRLPVGIQLTGASLYGEGDWLRMPQLGLQNPNLWMVTSGATAGLLWRVNNRQTEFSAGYEGGYNRNQRVSALTGFSHEIALNLRTELGRGTTLALAATGQSGILADALFEPSFLLTTTQQAPSISQLADGLDGAGSGVLENSPLNLALAGMRRKAGIADLSLTHMHSRKLSSFLHLQGARELRSYSQPDVGDRVPNFTTAVADLGLSYSLSPRTRITGIATYARSYSRLARSEWQAGTGGVERLLGRRSFVSVQGGYARIAEPGSNGLRRNSYTVSGSAGTNWGYHTVAATYRRGMTDLYGMGAGVTTGASGVWSWMPAARAWSASASFGSERLAGGTGEDLQAWMGQASLIRRLSVHFQVAMTAVYLKGTGRDLDGATRAGLRLSLMWTPAADRRR